MYQGFLGRGLARVIGTCWKLLVFFFGPHFQAQFLYSLYGVGSLDLMVHTSLES